MKKDKPKTIKQLDKEIKVIEKQISNLERIQGENLK